MKLVKFRAWIYKWYARLTGGHAIWLKNTRSGDIYLRIARQQFDPFVDNPALTVKHYAHGDKYLFVLNPEHNVISTYTDYVWRFVDNSKHVEQALARK